MIAEQIKWTKETGWKRNSDNQLSEKAQLVLAFGGRKAIGDKERFDELKKFYPKAQIVSCSTAGEILQTSVSDDSIVVSALFFEKTLIKTSFTNINKEVNSHEAGKKISKDLLGEDLCHIFVISDGQMVNGSELVKGLNEPVNAKIPITGGLAGDGANFEKTIVGLNETATEGNIVGIGFYGKHLKVSHGSKGGWDPFGPERIITKAIKNVLYELDGQSALQLYKKYLGERANELPGAALLFPLSIKTEENSEVLVRTILSVDEAQQTMTFAGDMPIGAKARLMKANFDRLIDGAVSAASQSLTPFGSQKPEFALLISCVGRKLVLEERIEEEIEEAQGIFGNNTVMAGFYSYGEISPILASTKCELHNQTMTITTYSEA